MPINRIASTKRGKAAVAAVLVAAAAGPAAYLSIGAPTADTPLAVTLAMKELIRPWEGRRLIAYRDIVGVLTI